MQPLDWQISKDLVAYEDALSQMEAYVERIYREGAPDRVWLLEHPPLYTLGTSAHPQDVLTSQLPLYSSGRGGQVTYHGPGQRVAYVMLDLKRRQMADVRAFVCCLEQWIIESLAAFHIQAERRDKRVGVWVERPDKPPSPSGEVAEDKIAAMGIRIRHWVTFHGMALNVHPDLSPFQNIIPCGIHAPHLGVTSLADLGCPASLSEVDDVLKRVFEKLFV